MGGRQIRSATANPLNDDEIRELFEQADLNGDGALNDRECNGFCDAIRMFHGLRTPLTEEFYAIVLDELDPDQTGQIYLDDLKELYLAIWDERRVSVLNPDAPPPEIEDDEEAEGRQALEALAAELPPPTPAEDRFTANGEGEGQLHAAVEGSLLGEDGAASDGLGGRVGDDVVAIGEDAERGSEEGVLPLGQGVRVADDDQEGGDAEEGLLGEREGELIHDTKEEEGSVEEGLVLEKTGELIHAGEGGEQRLVALEGEFVSERVGACADEGSPVPATENDECLSDDRKDKGRASVTEVSEESEYCKAWYYHCDCDYFNPVFPVDAGPHRTLVYHLLINRTRYWAMCQHRSLPPPTTHIRGFSGSTRSPCLPQRTCRTNLSGKSSGANRSPYHRNLVDDSNFHYLMAVA
ncbi:hypothetical protein FOZ62_025682 [Perkinsus olseni]|uniref:EF-hand domain-containing protein n=1 Tax=Perkinsus olseni TaxID=32597 RepID=A0A7J6RAF0_PEROL|nr:hypothetical protein FOZ62_025682 [Perkinsus olseni]